MRLKGARGMGRAAAEMFAAEGAVVVDGDTPSRLGHSECL
jgi:NAD(P)-dependent dehydrogenase (short-subunit alcohol dehydrogenase family)